MNFIGLDIGTTGAKALLVNEKGGVLGKGYEGYRLLTDGSCIEQRADDWTECGAKAIQQAIQGQDPASIAAISLSTQGASTVAMDARHQPIGNALTWMDTRATREAAMLADRLGNEYIYRHTGWRISPVFDAAKILYMKQSEVYKHAAQFLSTLEYVNLFLTGNPVCDPSNSSIRQIFDVVTGDYDENILGCLNVKRHELPQVLPTGAFVGNLNQTAAQATGLIQGTPVFNGAHDQYCASLGAAAIEKGDMLLSAGTTWVIMGIDDKPLFTNTFIAPGLHPISGLYGAIASLVGSGSSLQWFKNEFLAESFEEIDRQAATRQPKTHDLFFYPYVSGANYPIWNLNARGSLTGISLDHDRFDFARAIMESAAFGVRQALEDFSANGCSIKKLKFMGGAARSDLWTTLIAAAAQVEVEISTESDACALGAAMIAATGAKAYPNLRAAVQAMSAKTICKSPDRDLVSVLDEKYLRYQHMWNGIEKYYE